MLHWKLTEISWIERRLKKWNINIRSHFKNFNYKLEMLPRKTNWNEMKKKKKKKKKKYIYIYIYIYSVLH